MQETNLKCYDKVCNLKLENHDCKLSSTPNTTNPINTPNCLSSLETATYRCNVCGMTFESKSFLKFHISKHNGKPRRYKPEMFQYKTAEEHWPTNHTMQLHASKNKCNFCKVTFENWEDLKKHIKIHSTQKPYTCKVCLKLYSNSSAFKKHKNTHVKQDQEEKKGLTLDEIKTSGLKLWCKHCNLYFCVTDFRQHQKVYKVDLPYGCAVCKCSFSCYYNLRKHVKSKHQININSTKSYKIRKQHKAFQTERTSLVHKATQTPD